MSQYKPDLEMVRFFDTWVQPTVVGLFENTHRLTALSNRLRSNLAGIQKRFGHNLRITLSDKASKDTVPNGYLPFGYKIDASQPTICIFMPAQIQVLDAIKRSHPFQYKEVFEGTVAIGLIHETDHFALGIDCSSDISQTVKIESAVWALTCEHAIRPYVEIHGQVLNPSDQRLYLEWLKAGRNAESASWISFIQSMYGSLQYAPKRP
jgi:hypothetical protein